MTELTKKLDQWKSVDGITSDTYVNLDYYHPSIYKLVP